MAKQVNIRNRVQVDVLSEYIDLLRNGYVVRSQYFGDDFWHVKLKHMINTRELTLTYSQGVGILREGHTELKKLEERGAMCKH